MGAADPEMVAAPQGRSEGHPRQARGSPSLEIRASRVADANGLRRVLDAVACERRHLALLEAPPVEAIQRFIESIASTPSVQLVALDGERIVGWCDIIADARESFRHSGVLGMGLLARYRGKGLGRALLRETVSASARGGITRVELEVFASNTQAIALYEGFGFRHEGVKVSGRLIDGRSDDIVCTAWLSPNP